jgi:hypothetical protein
MSYRGAELRLAGGAFRFSTESFTFPPEFGYKRNTTFLKVFVLAYTKFLCDSPLEKSSPRPLKVYKRFLYRLINNEIGNTIRLFSGYADTVLRDQYVTGADSTTGIFHDFMKDTPVFPEYLAWHRTRNPELLKYLISFLWFGKKIEYDNPELNAAALRKWHEVEDGLQKLKFGEHDLSSLKTIISVLIPKRLPLNVFLPKFGPGRVAERGVVDAIDKLGKLGFNRRLAFAFMRERPGRSRDEGFAEDIIRRIVQGDDSSDDARIKDVWKDIRTARTICMEPNGYMYAQQDVWRGMRVAIRRGRINRFVNLDDQTPNQIAALHGSTYLCSDTIDLSSASDSVHVDLVRHTFPRDYWFFMLATRTGKVIRTSPAGDVIIHVKKFAPMGSAICFPTQCIIFTAVAIYAYMSAHLGVETGSWTPDRNSVIDFMSTWLHKGRNEFTPFTRRYEPPVIFGDDIITDTRVTDTVISTLSRLGFSVNRSKSFTGSQALRESCGVFGYEGQDVTPVIFRLPSFQKGKFDAKQYAAFIGGINKFSGTGYYHVSSFLLSILREYGFQHPIPFTTDSDCFGIFTKQKKAVKPTSLRWNADWQIYEERQQGIGPRQVRKKDPPTAEAKEALEQQKDAYRMNQWWRSRVSGGTPSSFGKSLTIRPQETRLAMIWARRE